jgi:hypothetical protein
VLTPGNQKRIPRAEVERITREMQGKASDAIEFFSAWAREVESLREI